MLLVGSFIAPASKGKQPLSEGCDGSHHVREERTVKILQIKHALEAGEFVHIATYLELKRKTDEKSWVLINKNTLVKGILHLKYNPVFMFFF